MVTKSAIGASRLAGYYLPMHLRSEHAAVVIAIGNYIAVLDRKKIILYLVTNMVGTSTLEYISVLSIGEFRP